MAGRAEKRPVKNRRKKGFKAGFIFGFAILMSAGMFSGMVWIRCIDMEKKEAEYRKKEAAVLSSIKEEEERAKELEEYRIYIQTKQSMEETAKQKLGLVKPGEILVKPRQN